MKLYIVAPPQAIKALRAVGQVNHMVLGQELLRNQAYHQFHMGNALKHHSLYIDNGAAEFDQPLFPIIFNIGQHFNPDLFVMPDVLRDGAATIRAQTTTVDIGHGALSNPCELVAPPFRMYVPQGKTFEEWRLCAETLLTRFESIALGVTRQPTWGENGRLTALKWLREEFNPSTTYTHRIHLLGCVKNKPLGELERCLDVYPELYSVDTGAPIGYAQAGMQLADGVGHYPLKWNADCPDNGEIEANIERIRDICNGRVFL